MSTMRFKVAFSTKGRRTERAPAPPEPSSVPVSSTARQLALAYWIEQRIEEGRLRDLAEAARLLGVSRARMTQIANLRLLPVAVQEEILAPGFKGGERRLRSAVRRLDAERPLEHPRRHVAVVGSSVPNYEGDPNV